MIFMVKPRYSAEHLVFGREEPGPVPPALSICTAMLPTQTPTARNTAVTIYSPVLVRFPLGLVAPPV